LSVANACEAYRARAEQRERAALEEVRKQAARMSVEQLLELCVWLRERLA
jgi:hypothetical protein